MAFLSNLRRNASRLLMGQLDQTRSVKADSYFSRTSPSRRQSYFAPVLAVATLTRRRRSRASDGTPQAGFTLLEAIVALAIIGITLVPVMSFFAQSSQQLASAAEANQRSVTTQTILAFIETLNPTVLPEGEAQLSTTTRIAWTSEPLLPDGSLASMGGRLGSYQLKFYRVDITVFRGLDEWFQIQVRKVGYMPRNLSITGMPQE